MSNNKKWYVTATDKFLSGWGCAEGKKSKVIKICNTYAEAEEVSNKWEKRSDFIYVNISNKKPYYNSKNYKVDYID